MDKSFDRTPEIDEEDFLSVQQEFHQLSNDIEALRSTIPPNQDTGIITKLIGIRDHIESLLDHSDHTNRGAVYPNQHIIEHLQKIIRKTKQTLLDTTSIYDQITSIQQQSSLLPPKHEAITINNTNHQDSAAASNSNTTTTTQSFLFGGVLLMMFAFLLTMVIVLMVFMKRRSSGPLFYNTTQKCVDNICTTNTTVGVM